MNGQPCPKRKTSKWFTRLGILLFCAGIACYLPVIMMMVFVPSEWGTTDPAILQWLYHALFSLVWVGVVGSILLLLSLPLNVIAVFREPVRRWRVVSGAMGGVLLIRLTWGVYDAAATPYVDRDDWAKSVRQEYLKDEGHADRGERFAEYVLLLDQDVFAGTRVMAETELVDLLGPPDLMYVDGNVKQLAYFHDRFGRKGWVVYVVISYGKVLQFGYNSVEGADYSDWRTYQNDRDSESSDKPREGPGKSAE